MILQQICIHCGAVCYLKVDDIYKDDENVKEYALNKLKEKAKYHCTFFDKITRKIRLKIKYD